MPDRVEAAAGLVDWRRWSIDAMGQARPQSIPRALVVDMLRMLEVTPGARVLEVGTGSGYNTAVLAHLVTPTGSLTSIDIDPEVVERVGPLLLDAGLPWVRVLCADARGGYPARAPYDRIVSWAAAPGFPAEWRGQLRPDGVAVLPLTGTPAVVRRFRHVEGRIQGDGAIPGEFVKLTGWPAVM